jgi:hypothetical protein
VTAYEKRERERDLLSLVICTISPCDVPEFKLVSWDLSELGFSNDESTKSESLVIVSAEEVLSLAILPLSGMLMAHSSIFFLSGFIKIKLIEKFTFEHF